MILNFKRNVLEKWRTSQKGGRTVIVVSHNLATIKSLCTRCVEIKNGSVGNTGVPSDVVRNYLHEHSAEYADTSGFISKDASLYNTGVIKFDVSG